MATAVRRSVRLHFHIWTWFGSLVLLVGALICSINYVMTKDALERSVTDTTQRVSRESLEEVENLLQPAQMAVRLLSHSSLADARWLAQRKQRMALMRDALESSPILQALYIGYADGSFFYMRPLRDEGERAAYKAPPRAAFLVQSVDRDSGRAVGRYYYLASDLDAVGEADAADFAGRYDPRTRPWYASAMASGTLVRTDPYMFYSDRESGATLALRTADGQAVVGGDFRLDALGQLLNHETLTPRAVLALLDRKGKLVAINRTTPDSVAAPDTVIMDPAGRPEDYGLAVLTGLAVKVAAPGDPQAVAHPMLLERADGEDWYTSVDWLDPKDPNSLLLVSAIPQAELLHDARQHAAWGMVMTGLVLLLALPVTWLVARSVARPLQSLAAEADAIRRFDFVRPVSVRSQIDEVNDLAITMDQMRGTIQRMLHVMGAVSAEHRLDRLLPLLLQETLSAAGGQAGALYLAASEDEGLRPAVGFDRSGTEVTTMRETLAHDTLALVRTAVREGTARAGHLTSADVAAARLDVLAGAAPVHAAVIPLINRQQALLGVVLVLRDTPIEAAQLAFASTMASLSAGALEVGELTTAQRDLFDAFIRLLAGAIDAKSPHTGGHCARVPELAKLLARAACDATEGPYRSFDLTETEWEALHVAAWLHDCGKVTTPDYVIDKATKLETLHDRIHEVRMRFEVLKRDAEIACLQAVADGEDPQAARERRDGLLRQLDEEFAFVAACNVGGEQMDAGDQARLRQIATRTWRRTLDDRLGVSHEELTRRNSMPAVPLPVMEPLLADRPDHRIERAARDQIADINPWGFRLRTPEFLYDRGELHNLTISRGTLTAEERFKIEDHIVQTQIMLSRLPFPKHLRDVPEIAGGHHEKMDGTGYPRGLKRDQMSPLARMMGIADIFEALTAADRPYKKAKTLSEAVGIMTRLRDQQHIDAELFDLFIAAGIHRTYAERYMDPALIDMA
ncbi:Chemotactic transducer-related protein [Cupriavidus sp. U2]|uniref:HD domain-containing phosphohydrolase n=1 Tax=Cupriavidus sp. U2 TaxID=2920269 RepID=UPI00129D4BCC|nr:HD domain-containing phosphohydrolase [Cupriavidus sp. U2]KAI3593756.1 Chemotactic transducer-related protein [Cupriavidus sp. U2]